MKTFRKPVASSSRSINRRGISFGLVPLFRDPAIVLKDELKWIPFYGWFCVKFEHILVKREKASAALKTMIRDAKQRISIGREVVIFPEGTRTVPGAPPDYKSGYVALYEALGVVTVPLALNSGLFWPRRSPWRYPGTIVVEFLQPLPPGLPRAEFRSSHRGRDRRRKHAPDRRGRRISRTATAGRSPRASTLEPENEIRT